MRVQTCRNGTPGSPGGRAQRPADRRVPGQAQRWVRVGGLYEAGGWERPGMARAGIWTSPQSGAESQGKISKSRGLRMAECSTKDTSTPHGAAAST